MKEGCGRETNMAFVRKRGGRHARAIVLSHNTNKVLVLDHLSVLPETGEAG
jgi:hypothetical protein